MSEVNRFEAEVFRLKGERADVVAAMKELGFGATSKPVASSEEQVEPVSWNKSRAETFMKDLVAHNLQDVVAIVKGSPGILGNDFVKAMKLSTKKQLAGLLSAVTKLARRGGNKDALAITSVWIGTDHRYNLDPTFAQFLK